MIRFIICLTILTSCSNNYKSLNNDPDILIPYLIECFILTDSMNRHGAVHYKLGSYTHYNLKYTIEGYRHPAPGANGHKWKNEIVLLESIDLNEYFDIADSVHIKRQIINSKTLANQYDLSSLDSATLGTANSDKLIFYHFYTPIFNKDSTAVYVEYDHFDNGYGDGNAVVFIKKNGNWIYYKFILGWIT